MIQFKQITKYFDGTSTPAIQNLNLDIKQGEFLVILGASGSGKSTTLKMINRLIEPSSGEILIHNQNIRATDIHTLRRNIGYVFQGIGLFPHLNIYDNLATVLQLYERNRKHQQATIQQLLERVHLDFDQYAYRFPDELSGGQQQRVGVARALLGDPEILLMDEPFGALDAITRDALQTEILALHRQLQKTTIFVTHDLLEAFRLCDRIAVFNHGQLEQIGTKHALIHHPETPYVKALITKQREQLQHLTQVLE